MTILLTGAASGLGLALAGRLVAEQRSLRVLTRRPYRIEQHLGAAIDLREWHPIGEPLPAGALDGVTTIVHLLGDGAEGRAPAAQDAPLTTLRRIGAEKLLAAFAGRPIRLIMASTVAVYDDVAGEVYTESSAPCAPRTALQKAALEWEATAGAARAAGASVAIARLGLVTGSDTLLDDLADRVAMGRAVSLAKVMVPLIDLDDAVALLVGLIDNPGIDGPINAVTPQAVTGEVLARLLSDAIGRRMPFALPGLGRARMRGMNAELLTRRSRVVPRRLMELSCTFTKPDAASCVVRIVEAARERHAQRLTAGDIVRGVRAAVGQRVGAVGRRRPDTPARVPAGPPRTDGRE